VGLPGDVYFNTTNKQLYVSDGSSWAQASSPNNQPGYYFGQLNSPAIGYNTYQYLGHQTAYFAYGWWPSIANWLVCTYPGTYEIGVHVSYSIGAGGNDAYGSLSFTKQSGAGVNLEARTITTDGEPPSYWNGVNGSFMSSFEMYDRLSVQFATYDNTAAHAIDGRSWIWVLPVGGFKGQRGATGAYAAAPITGGISTDVLVKQSSTDFDAKHGANPDFTSWSAVTFAPGFANYVNGYGTCRWRRAYGRIELTGLAQYTGTLAAGTNICSGWPVPSGVSETCVAVANCTARVDMGNTGFATYQGPGAQGYAPVASPWISLEGCSVLL
jgi:hypothetical protein